MKLRTDDMAIESVGASSASEPKVRERKQVERKENNEKAEQVAEQKDNSEKSSARQSLAVA